MSLVLNIGDKLLGNTIKEVILSADTFIVYMDEKNCIQWVTEGHLVFGNNFGILSNKISYWETMSNKIFDKEDSYNFKCLLAEGYARILDSGDDETANQIVDQTIEHIKKDGAETFRQRYILSSFYTSAIFVVILILIVFIKSLLLTHITNDTYNIILAGLFGGIGAFIFAMTRSKNYNADVTINKHIHNVDGILRVIFGCFAGVIVALGIKSNIVLGIIGEKADKNCFMYAFIGAISGASEVILPNIIKQVENSNNQSENSK